MPFPEPSSTTSRKGQATMTNVNIHSSTHHDPELRTNSAYLQLNQALAGAGSGFVTRFLTQPFDVLKIRFQLQVEPVSETERRYIATHKKPPRQANEMPQSRLPTPAQPVAHQSKYTSMMQACRLIYREEGIKAFWKGHNAGQYMTVLYTIIQFWSYEQFHLRLSQTPMLLEHHAMTDFMSGALAGSVGMLVAMPFDVIRTRVVAQDPGKGYNNVLAGFSKIINTEGVRGLFRGFGPTIMQIGPLVGGNFMFYNSSNELARKILDQPTGTLPTWCLLMTGGFSGVASKAVVYPLDFVKKRLQIRGFEKQRQTFGRNQACTSSLSCIKMTIRDEGLLGFYKGLWPTLLKSGFTTALFFCIYDKLKMFLVGEE